MRLLRPLRAVLTSSGGTEIAIFEAVRTLIVAPILTLLFASTAFAYGELIEFTESENVLIMKSETAPAEDRSRHLSVDLVEGQIELKCNIYLKNSFFRKHMAHPWDYLSQRKSGRLNLNGQWYMSVGDPAESIQLIHLHSFSEQVNPAGTIGCENHGLPVLEDDVEDLILWIQKALEKKFQI